MKIRILLVLLLAISMVFSCKKKSGNDSADQSQAKDSINLDTVKIENRQVINTAVVIAPNGLVLREKPDKNSTRLGKLNKGVSVEIIEKTNIKMDIVDEGKSISGFWVAIRAKIPKDTMIDNKKTQVWVMQKAYVFDGFLGTAAGNNTDSL